MSEKATRTFPPTRSRRPLTGTGSARSSAIRLATVLEPPELEFEEDEIPFVDDEGRGQEPTRMKAAARSNKERMDFTEVVFRRGIVIGERTNVRDSEVLTVNSHVSFPTSQPMTKPVTKKRPRRRSAAIAPAISFLISSRSPSEIMGRPFSSSPTASFGRPIDRRRRRG